MKTYTPEDFAKYPIGSSVEYTNSYSLKKSRGTVVDVGNFNAYGVESGPYLFVDFDFESNQQNGD